MPVNRKPPWPLTLTLVLFFVTVLFILLASLKLNDGFFIYALDDPYIHMAVAKHFVANGIWGTSRYSFSSAESSLLWPLLLSLLYLPAGPWETAPLLLNLIVGALSIGWLFRILTRYIENRRLQCAALIALAFLLPMPALAMMGMEHILQFILAAMFVYYAARMLEQKNSSRWEDLMLILLGLLNLMTRYEGMFLVFIVVILFLIRKRPLFAISLAVLSFLPLAVFGLISISHGWHFFPNTILIKGSPPTNAFWQSLGKLILYDAGFQKLVKRPELVLLILTVLFLLIFSYYRDRKFWETKKIMSVIFLAVAYLHLHFAMTGMYRYEAYLVGLGVFNIILMLTELGPLPSAPPERRQLTALVVFFILLAYPFTVRGGFSLFTGRGLYSPVFAAMGAQNIYQQQYQMARFLNRYYPGAGVVANDVGAINYFADIRCLDILGLSNIDILRLKWAGKFTPEEVDALARKDNVKLAVIYNHWLYSGIPDRWVKVGEWEIPRQVVCSNRTVTFYATDPAFKDELVSRLKAFSACLPKAVKQRGAYLN